MAKSKDSGNTATLESILRSEDTETQGTSFVSSGPGTDTTADPGVTRANIRVNDSLIPKRKKFDTDQPATSNVKPTMNQPTTVNASPTVDQPTTVNASPTVDQPTTSDASPTVDQPTTVNASPTVDQPTTSDASPTVDQPTTSNASPTVDQPATSKANPVGGGVYKFVETQLKFNMKQLFEDLRRDLPIAKNDDSASYISIVLEVHGEIVCLIQKINQKIVERDQPSSRDIGVAAKNAGQLGETADTPLTPNPPAPINTRNPRGGGVYKFVQTQLKFTLNSAIADLRNDLPNLKDKKGVKNKDVIIEAHSLVLRLREELKTITDSV